jgi:PAS domain S-box-containing protein
VGDRALRELLTTVGLLALTLDMRGNLTFCNDALLELTGWQREEVIGQSWFEAFLPAEVRETMQPVFLPHLLSETMPRHYENEIITRSGERRLVRWNNTILRDRHGRPIGAASIGEDITERRRAEEALRQSEERYRTLVENTPDWIWAMDTEHRLTYCSSQVEAILGYTPAELLGRPALELVSGEWLEENHHAFRIALEGATSSGRFMFEVVLQHRSGAPVHTEVNATRILDGCGQLVGYRGIARDTTERRQAEESLRRRLAVEELVGGISTRFISVPASELETTIEQELETVASFVGADVCFLDLYSPELTTITACYESGSARVSLGWEGQARIVGTSLAEYGWAIEQLQRGQVVDVPSVDRLPAAGGGEGVREFWLSRGMRSILMIPLFQHARLIGSLGFHSLNRELSWPREYHNLLMLVGHIMVSALTRRGAEVEKDRLQAQFLQAQKMEAVGRLTAGVAHDFNNLLMVINGYASLMQGDPQQAPIEQWQEWADKISDAGQRAADLTKQLLIFSHKHLTEMQLVDLNRIVGDMESVLLRALGEDIQLQSRLAADLWPVRADPSQLTQVILNLAINARDAMPGGGQLTIETENVDLDESYAAGHVAVKPGQYVLMAIRDTGVGMSQEVQAHLFEPFFTTKAPGKGTGLGLATVYGIIHQCGGHVWVYSEEGRGTTFKIYLPRAPAEMRPADERVNNVSLPTGTETVLLVEDNDGVREMVRRVLTGCGYTVLEASHAELAFQVASTYSGVIHLLLTDMVMPGMHGKALAGPLTASRPEMKVLYMSGYAGSSVIEGGLDDRPFMQKPFSPAVLATRVRELLDTPWPAGSGAPSGDRVS